MSSYYLSISLLSIPIYLNTGTWFSSATLWVFSFESEIEAGNLIFWHCPYRFLSDHYLNTITSQRAFPPIRNLCCYWDNCQCIRTGCININSSHAGDHQDKNNATCCGYVQHKPISIRKNQWLLHIKSRVCGQKYSTWHFELLHLKKLGEIHLIYL